MLVNSRSISVILLACCIACNGEPPQPQTPSDTTQAPVPPGVMVPNQKADSIQIEGAWQPMTLRLVMPASSIPFLTYMPADMIAESNSSADGEGHHFYANFGGQRNNEAFLLMFFFPAGTTEEEAVRLARAFKHSRTRAGFVVNTELKRHGERYYYIAEHYPAEYGDGFGPRARRIQDEWQWLDPH